MSLHKISPIHEIWVLENFVSDQFCENLIEQAKIVGFKNAKFAHHGRKNKETIIKIKSKVKDQIDDQIIKTFNQNQGVQLEARYFEPKVEVYQYDIGDYIAPHIDCPRHIEKYNLETSHTIIIYLNDSYLGGETFFTEKNIGVKGLKKSCLIFNNQFLHEAKKIIKGTKYIARFDAALSIIDKTKA